MKKVSKKKFLERQQQKTSEGEFLYELKNSYELSPKMSTSILESAKLHLIRDNILKEGQVEISVVHVEERSGKFIEDIRKCRVRLTVDSGEEDIEVLREFGNRALRQIRISRITQDAIEQNGVMSQEDLSKCLSRSIRTIKRVIKQLKERGIEVFTRGVLHNIGRGQTHKEKIIGLYLDGNTFSEIKRKTQHSVGAIKKYLQSFIRVLMSHHYGLQDISEISSVSGMSDYLVRQYIKIIEESKTASHKSDKLAEIISQSKRADQTGKKTLALREFGLRAVHTTGGVI